MTSAAQDRIAAALARLDAIARRLRRECPWDREQDERTIVPYTVEEAYELADAAHRRDDRKLLDELGDVLYQVHFLALLLEERGAGDLAQVAEHCREKLIRRHPHVFGDAEVSDSRDVLRNWDRIKQGEAGREPGLFGEIPETLPALLYARKVQRRAVSHGVEIERPPVGECSEALESAEDPDERFVALGELLFAVVDVARRMRVDPELALRAASDRFRERVVAAREGGSWKDARL